MIRRNNEAELPHGSGLPLHRKLHMRIQQTSKKHEMNCRASESNQAQWSMIRESVQLWRSPRSRRGGQSRRRGGWGGRGACSSPSWGRRTAGRLRRRGPRRPRRRRRRGSWRRRRPLFWSERKKDRRRPVKRLYSQSPPNSFQLDNEKGPTSTHFSSPFFFFLIYPTHKKIQIQK